MAQTPDGAIRSSAKKLGITEAEHRALSAAGLKRCTVCKQWRSRKIFGCDASRHDGLAASCLPCRKVLYKRLYVPRPKVNNAGRRYSESRDGDKRQARGRANILVRSGLLPNPNTIPCVDCNHFGDGPRHEYD